MLSLFIPVGIIMAAGLVTLSAHFAASLFAASGLDCSWRLFRSPLFLL